MPLESAGMNVKLPEKALLWVGNELWRAISVNAKRVAEQRKHWVTEGNQGRTSYITENLDKLYDKCMFWPLVLILFVLLASFSIEKSAEEKIVFLDVGQGDSILLQSGTKQVLVDGGPGMKVLEELGEQMPWWDRSIEVRLSSYTKY